MGISDSKFISKKIEKTIIKCPIETTEILASDCESVCNSQFIKPSIFSVTNINTLTSQQSIDSVSNLSFFDADDSQSPEDKSALNKNRPLIQNLNSKIELLDKSMSDRNLSVDEFSSSEGSVENNHSLEEQSNESQYNESSESSRSPSEISKPDQSLSDNPHLYFNKEFMQNFKERYSTSRSPLPATKTRDFGQEKIVKNGDGDDSFTEITNMLPNDTNKSASNNKEHEIKYLKDILLKKAKSDKNSDHSVTNNSMKLSENHKDKQVRSMPILKVDMSNSLCSNSNHKMINSLSAEIDDYKPGFKCLCYKFWVDATFDTWKVFHNTRDRRIESIGRLSNCQIRLTKITQRSSKGMLKRQVNVYASSLSALEKCCKLFDDKFPYFCASSGLNIESCT